MFNLFAFQLLIRFLTNVNVRVLFISIFSIMRVLHIFSCVLFLLAGTVNIIQSAGHLFENESENLVQATVKKKIIRQTGDVALKVTYANKDYWVKVTPKKFNYFNPDKQILLKYNREKDLIVDAENNQSPLIPGLLLLAASGFVYYFGVRRN